MKKQTASVSRIGVYDSGIGGFSVLEPLMRLFPAQYLYFADTAHFPYGSKSPEFLKERVSVILNFFITNQVDLIIVACNTVATAIYHRPLYVSVPVITIIDFLAHAALEALGAGTVLGIMATQATIESKVYRTALLNNNNQVSLIEQACPGLADAIENQQSEHIHHLITRYSLPLKTHDIDVLLLACTHYHFIKPHLERIFDHHIPIVCICQQFPLYIQSTYHAVADSSSCTFFVNNDKKILEYKIKHLLGCYSPKHVIVRFVLL